MTAKFTDSQGRVRNIEVRVMPSSIKCKPVQADCQKRHVSNLEVIVPNEDQANNENEHLDAEDKTSDIIEEFDDVPAKSTDEQIVVEVIENEARELIDRQES